MPLGLEASWGALFDVLGVSWRGPGVAQRIPGEALEASWRLLGAPKAAWSAKGGHPGVHGALLEASWDGLGGLLELSWTISEASWTPKGCPKQAQEVPKWSPGGVLNGKLWNLPKPQNS